VTRAHGCLGLVRDETVSIHDGHSLHANREASNGRRTGLCVPRCQWRGRARMADARVDSVTTGIMRWLWSYSEVIVSWIAPQ
jgi:hypothetical protein